MRPSINALKGYNFQGSIYCYLLCLMDLEREIIELDAEISIDNNFDDIFVKTCDDSFYLQVKNYKDITFDKIAINGEKIDIEGHSSILIGNKKGYDNNILIIRNLEIPKEKINSKIFGMDCIKFDNCYILGWFDKECNQLVKALYDNEERYNNILLTVDEKLNTGNFNFTIHDLPPLNVFEQKLQEETKIIRNFSLNNKKDILFIIGKPGVGKSHLVTELEEQNIISNAVIERLWISENDKDKINRLKYSNFIRDISYNLFNKSLIENEESIIKTLKKRNITLIVDGLDHVENYNVEELELYFDFFKNFVGTKLIVLSRPLKHDIDYEKIELNNWTEQENMSYLDSVGLSDYNTQLQIYDISKGYPIITAFLGNHFLLNGELPRIEEVTDIFDFYDKLISKGIAGLSLFLINNSYFKMKELEELLSKRECKILFEIIKQSRYLFSIHYDRVYLIHDSLNTYLRIKNPEYLEDNQDAIKKIKESIINEELKYLSRVNRISLNAEDKVSIVKKYCNFNFINEVINKTVDFEMIQDIMREFECIIYDNGISFNLNEMYEFILIKECTNRNHHDDFYQLIIERIKYYIKNNLISFEDIYSTGLLYYTYSCFKENKYAPLSTLYSTRFNDADGEISDFADALEKSSKYFDFLKEKIDVEGYLKNNIKNIDISDKDVLIKIISYLYINKLEYNNYEKVAIAAIDEHNDNKAEKLFKEICLKYNIRPFMAKSGIYKLKDYLFSLGIDNGDNYYKNKSLKEIIRDKAISGSFYVNDYICNYIRLAIFENRIIDISSVGLYYFMYYNRKDYSLYKLPLALIIFYRKEYIHLDECIKILDNSMEMSEKGIRTIMTDFYNLLSNEEFELAKKYWNDKIILTDLDAEKINLLSEEIVVSYFMKHVIGYHMSFRDVDYNDIYNLLKSKYSKRIVDLLKFYYFKIDSIDVYDFDFKRYHKKDNYTPKSFEERNFVYENDADKLKEYNVSCTELAKCVDGWHNTLPYVELFDIYSIEDIKDKIHVIIYNSCFSYKIFNMYANRSEMLGNYLMLLDRYSILEVDWDKLYSCFLNFLNLSLIK